MPIPPEKMAEYRASAQRRRQAQCDRRQARYELAQQVAQQAADILKAEFGAEQVVLFGSMLSPERVHERSDLDLAVGGLPPSQYYRALGRLLNLDARIPVDLIEMESAPARLRSEIAKGRDL